ncbi:MAG: GHMP kinase [Planctomycetota bacterium]
MSDATLTRSAFARAGLIGNPSDGYFGKTIAFTFSDFKATVSLTPSDRLLIAHDMSDKNEYESFQDLIDDVNLAGYYGGVRLIKATLKRFYQFVLERNGVALDGNVSVSFTSDIPMRVGLAGSSAIIISLLRALLDHYRVDIPLPEAATLALKVETDELGIPAGLQDRVVQTYQGIVYMDFNRERMNDFGYGNYERLTPAVLPPFYIAYCKRIGEGTEVTHSDLRRRFNDGDRLVRSRMKKLAENTDRFRDALDAGDLSLMNELIDMNFDIRTELVPIAPVYRNLVNIARNCGASAKFTGSGGAIIGIADDAAFHALENALDSRQFGLLRPTIAF